MVNIWKKFEYDNEESEGKTRNAYFSKINFIFQAYCYYF